MPNSDAVVEVRDRRMRSGSKDVLAGVEFEVHRGEVVCLLGPNGAGKTTTIEILEGFRSACCAGWRGGRRVRRSKRLATRPRSGCGERRLTLRRPVHPSTRG